MSTAPNPLSYQYYQPYAQNAGYNTTSNPVQAAKNLAEFSVNTGGQLLNEQQQLEQLYGQQQAGTETYLSPLEQTQAEGGGGYTADQAAQIQLTPEQQQNIVTGAGISSGVNTAASVAAAERAAAASGGNPAAMATYRQRAAQTQGAQAGDAETQARIAAQQAGSAGAQAVGNARLAQENQGLQYFGNLGAEQGTQQATEAGLGNQTFATETGGLGEGTKAGVSAAAVPTTSDKIIGGLSSAAGAAAAGGLADGRPNYLAGDDDSDGGQDAVIGEDGPEAVIPGPSDVVRGASDPVRSHTKFMDVGNVGITPPAPAAPTAPGAPPASAAAPPGSMPPWLQAALQSQNKQQQQPGQQPGQPGWNKTTPYTQLGTAIGSMVKPVKNWITGQGNVPGMGQGGGQPGFTNMPYAATVPTPAMQKSTMPGGLINRTGNTIDGTPSLPQPAGTPAPSYLNGDTLPPDLSNVSDFGASGGGPIADLSGGFSGAGDIASGVSDIGSGVGDVASGMGDVVGAFAADGRPPYLAGGRMSSGFHWSMPRPHLLRPPAGGYTPLDNNPRRMADGNVPAPPTFNPNANQSPLDSQSALQTDAGQRPQIITKPTLMHLERQDTVVPLSYRPKAKVRPSVAMAAMKPHMGGYRARA